MTAGLDARARQIEELAREGALPVRLLSAGAVARLRGVRTRGFFRGDRGARAARRENERIGGSRAQHDLIEFTLLKAYLNADRLEEARRLLSARRPGASGVPVTGVAAVH